MNPAKLLAAVLLLAFVLPAQAQMMAQITDDLVTEFAAYHPYPADFTPQIPDYQVEDDFSNVFNYERFVNILSASDRELLRKNHFVIKKSRFSQLYDIYNESTYDGTPLFVTTDAVLHTYHTLFDRMLAGIEMQEFIPALSKLTDALISRTAATCRDTRDSLTAQACRFNLAYLYVARKLLQPADTVVPDAVSALVDSELVLIGRHDGFHFSPVLGPFSMLDYSQFVPRGHYTMNDSLKAYFRAMMWYGWTIFTMEPELFGALSFRHTLQSILLVRELFALKQNSDLWEKVYLPTVFFVGRTDDPGMMAYRRIAETVYGPDFTGHPPEALADSMHLAQFMEQARQLEPPAIPNWIYGTFITYKGFRFMGQHFIPDAYMFAHLVLPYVGSYGNLRLMPKGLDIMAILGSGRAFTLLDSVYNETAYDNYTSQIEKFHKEFSLKPGHEWAQNLYWNWLYCLMPLLYDKSDGFPYFMRTSAWADKELFTALASWAELRHDAILYAKQSMSPCCIPPDPPHSYVEPNPHLYARLASLVRFTREGLDNQGLLLPGYSEKLDLFASLLLFLRDISIKELENIPRTVEDYQNIFTFGKVMERLVSETPDPQNPWQKNSDDMAVVADVHTDSNTDRCLEEGVGYPFEIYVIVPEAEGVQLTQGAVFSYYEFQQGIADRLTDEKWRALLREKNAPDLPRWVDGFMDTGAAVPDLMSGSPENIYAHEFMYTSIERTETPAVEFALRQNYPNPFNPMTRIPFSLKRPARVRLEVYNIRGQRISVLLDQTMSAGSHQISFNAQGLPSGIYFYRISAGNFTSVRKMAVLR